MPVNGANDSQEDGHNVEVWPLFELKAAWPPVKHDLGHGITLLSVTDEARDKLSKEGTGAGWVADGAYAQVQWVAAIDLPDAQQPVSMDFGARKATLPGGDKVTVPRIPNFEYRVAEHIMSVFLKAVRLFGDTDCYACDCVDAALSEDGNSVALFTVFDICSNAGRRAESSYAIPLRGDIGLLRELWDGVYDVMRLDKFRQTVFADEKWFAGLDAAATDRARVMQFLDELIARMEDAGLDTSPDSVRREFTAVIEMASKKGHLESSSPQPPADRKPPDPRYIAEGFAEVFSEQLAELLTNETRLGRAIGLFDKAFLLNSDLHHFLSMFLVLETLLNTEVGETAYKLALRGTRLLLDYCQVPRYEMTQAVPTDPHDLRKEFKDLYTMRSNVIHGSLPFNRRNVPHKMRSKLVQFVRLCLQTVLLNEDLRELFSARETVGRDPKQLRSFFQDMELGSSGG